MIKEVIVMSVKLEQIEFKATDFSNNIFEINTLEQIVECINNQHNIEQLRGTLYFDNKQQLSFEDKQAFFGAIFALNIANIIDIKLMNVA
ncbi:hypothetical protein BM527_04555 [Alteromonas sp. Mex14]|nr:hypothetical protein BM527_04555 [Alteromonas sp. Mex14]